MGSGLINPPEGTPSSIPNIPIPDYTQQAQQTAAGLKAAGWWDDLWKSFWEHLAPGPGLVIGLFASAIDSILAGAMNFVSALQGTNTPGFFSLVAATLSDLTGVEFSATAVQASFKQGGAPAANAAIGEAFLSLLVSEMLPGSKLPTGPGVTAASAFLGYAMAFAVREGNLAVLSELLPFEVNILGGLREYGTGMADALGLGRLTRLAMAPLMKILVQDPVTYDLNAVYTPTMLPAASMIKANWRGELSAGDLNTNLAKLGYSPQAIQALQVDSALFPSASQIIDEMRCGYISASDAAAALVVLGYPPDGAVPYTIAEEASRSASHLDTLISHYQTLMQNRWISADQLSSDLQAYGLSATEIQWVKTAVAPMLEYTTRELSASDLETAYLNGLIDLTYYAAWLTRQGYSLPDQAIMQYLLLIKQQKEVAADQLASWRNRIACLNAIAKGQPAPPGFDGQCNPTS